LGRKRTWTRQYLYALAACLIITSIPGCAPFNRLHENLQAWGSVYRAEAFAERGDFTRALELNQEALFRSPFGPPGDRALYNIGLIYVTPAYPDRDYEKAYGTLFALTERFPDSAYTQRARAWVNLLESARRVAHLEKQLMVQRDRIKALVQTRRRVSAREANSLEEIRRCQDLIAQGNFAAALEGNRRIVEGSSNPRRDEALFNMGLIYAHPANPDQDYKKSQTYFDRLVTEYPRSELAEQARVWVQLLQMIEKAKQVDIEIEEKKKELIR